MTKAGLMTSDQGRFEVKMTAGDHFAWLRTRMGLERTLMAWVRTAVSMIGFGFTIVQFFEKLGNMEGVTGAHRLRTPTYAIAWLLVLVGLFAFGAVYLRAL